MIENAPDKNLTNEQWCLRYARNLPDQAGLPVEQCDRMMNDLYVLQVDKCTDSQLRPSRMAGTMDFTHTLICIGCLHRPRV